MIIVMKPTANPHDRLAIIARLVNDNLEYHLWERPDQTVLVVTRGAIPISIAEQLETMRGVDSVVRLSKPYKLAARELQASTTIVDVGHVRIGGDQPVIIAGPCSVEGEEQLIATAQAVAAAGAHILRGGAFKPRTSPYAFRGLGEEGLRILAQAREITGLPFITEALNTRDVESIAEYADIIQIGARNMQNFALLEEAGRTGKPIMVKRGPAATVEEWLLAAEYVLSTGNPHVILCERGIRTYETSTRNTLDLNAVAVAKRLCHLPIIVDPSHGTGKWYLVEPLARAGLAVGADGLMIEVHHDPDRAVSDGPQSLSHENFYQLMSNIASHAIRSEPVVLDRYQASVGAL